MLNILLGRCILREWASRATKGVMEMTMLYGNLADAALGESRFVHGAQRHLKSATLKPATRILATAVLALVGLTALAVLGEVPDRFMAATPVIADLEDWLIWHDFQAF